MKGVHGVRRWRFFVAAVMAWWLVLPLAAQAASDQSRLEGAFAAADKGDWRAAMALAEQIKDPVARKLVQWRYYTMQDSGATFTEIAQFLTANGSWPQTLTMQRNAERAIPASLSPDQVIDWFSTRRAESARGKLRLGEAYLAKGNRAEGARLIQEAWVEGDFGQTEERQIIERHKGILTPLHHRLRVDRLMFESQRTAAQRMFQFLGGDERRLFETRLKLSSNQRGAEKLISEVPQALRNDAGLLYEQARWNRLNGRDQAAWTAILSAPPSRSQASASAWWEERNIQVRNAIDLGLYDRAYGMVKNHGLEIGSGADFAEAEFLAGWIALRFLDNAEAAVGHFKRLRTGVSYPISLARANYWLGRSAARAGRPAEAKQYYAEAAKLGETFYGQLALAELSPSAKLALEGITIDTKAAKPAFNANDLTRAIRLLDQINSDRYVRIFALHFADIAPDPATYALLANLLKELNRPGLALRAAKRAMQRHIPVLAYAYPVITVPKYRGRGRAPEQALVLGLTRQESEFDPGAVSGANARGMMQLMTETARQTARNHGIAFDKTRLTSDPEYNMLIGMAHLSDLLDSYNGSYVLSIAAYNAGGGNVRKWINTYGDPRWSSVDPIDWMEKIPFGETRNYVQRVLENTQVYRFRLSGTPVPLGTPADIRRARSGERTEAEPVTPVAAPPVEEAAVSGPAVTPTPKPGRAEAEPAAGPVPAVTPRRKPARISTIEPRPRRTARAGD